MLAALVSVVYLLASLLMAGHALLNKRDSRSALGWIACCLLVPLGFILYLIFGINRTRRSAREKRPQADDGGIPLNLSPAAPPVDFSLATIGYNITGKPLLPCNAIDVLVNGEQAYPNMLAAIASARRTVWLSTYIFANDDTGARFAQALVAAHERGIDVRIILDGMGEFMSLPRIGGKLRKLGLAVKRFNPLALIPPSLHLNMRNHRKLLAVDGKLAFTGGMNISGHHLVSDGSARHRVQDLHFKFQGNIVADLEYAFLKDWDYCAHSSEAKDYQARDTVYPIGQSETAWTRLILDGPNEHMDKFADTLIGIISAAHSRIWIMTPYFHPDAEIIGALQAAKLRNIDVKIVLSAENNIRLSHWATFNLLWQLLDYHVEIYYQPAPFSHTKLLLADSQYSLIGSANIDPRSIRLNFELGVEIFSSALNARLHAYFEDRITKARRLYSQDLAQRSLSVRIRDALAWLLTPYL
ncbi:MAG: phospholipase D-like domain-containing protein [Pseudomonadales bacterium]|nr:phospholipase D-like domain-containing protein [Pseudomonadales bacterium]